MIIKEKVNEVYPISVILDDTKDDYYINIKKGMDAAAVKYNVDINFITLYDYQLDKQMDIIREEEKAGSRGILLVPINTRLAGRRLEDNHIQIPLLLLGEKLTAYEYNNVGIDYSEAAAKLAYKIIGSYDLDTTINIFSKGLDYQGEKNAYEILIAKLSNAGYSIKLNLGSDNDNNFRSVIESEASINGEDMVIVSLDKNSTTIVAKLLSDGSLPNNHVKGVYGIGSTTYLLNMMDKDIIDGLVVWNEYDQGYMAVKGIIDKITSPGSDNSIKLNSYYITKEDIRDEMYQVMLYPVD